MRRRLPEEMVGRFAPHRRADRLSERRVVRAAPQEPPQVRPLGKVKAELQKAGRRQPDPVAAAAVNSPNLFVMTETDVEVVCEQIRAEKPDIVMIDSIQTMNLTELSSTCLA